MIHKGDIQALRQFSSVCVLRGSKIRGATKSFLTLTPSVACLLNRVRFFLEGGVTLCVYLCVTSWSRMEGETESEEGDGERRCRSHLGVKMTEGRKRRGRQKEQRMKRGTSRGQVFERNQCVWVTIPDLFLHFSTFLQNSLFSFLYHVDCSSRPVTQPFYLTWKETQTHTHVHAPLQPVEQGFGRKELGMNAQPRQNNYLLLPFMSEDKWTEKEGELLGKWEQGEKERQKIYNPAHMYINLGYSIKLNNLNH